MLQTETQGIGIAVEAIVLHAAIRQIIAGCADQWGRQVGAVLDLQYAIMSVVHGNADLGVAAVAARRVAQFKTSGTNQHGIDIRIALHKGYEYVGWRVVAEMEIVAITTKKGFRLCAESQAKTK